MFGGWCGLFIALLCINLSASALPQPEEAWNEGHAEPKSYKGHSLVRFVVESERERDILAKAVSNLGLDVWDEKPGKHAIARVPPKSQAKLREVLLMHQVLAPDLEPILLEEMQPAGETFHDRYHSAEEVDAFGHDLASRYAKFVRVEKFGDSVEGRPISAVHIAAAGGSTKAPVIFVQAGQHAREWIGPAAAMAAVEAIAESAKGAGGLPGYQLSLVLQVNPDGYQHTRTKDRMWRKNRDKRYTPPPAKPKPWQSPAVAAAAALGDGDCSGVDLNRNWGYHWAHIMKKGGQVLEGSSDACSETFPGKAKMTEPEVQTIAKHVLAQNGRVKAFLDVHSFSQKILPPGCNGFPVPDKDSVEHLRTAKAMVQAMSTGAGAAQYDTGPCAAKMYACAGTAADWAYGTAGVMHAFSVELRPSNEVLKQAHTNGFVLPPAQIKAAGTELQAGINALAKEALAHASA